MRNIGKIFTVEKSKECRGKSSIMYSPALLSRAVYFAGCLHHSAVMMFAVIAVCQSQVQLELKIPNSVTSLYV